jgi:hypothetical protein
MFRYDLSVPSSRFKQFNKTGLSDPRRFFLDYLTFEEGTDRLYGNVGNHQPALRHTPDERTRNSMST